MKKILLSLLFLLLLFSSNQLSAQWRLILETVVMDEGKKVSGAEIKVFRDGSLVETVLTDDRGAADIPMDPGGDYTLEIGGNKGLIKKKLAVSTKNVPPGAGNGDVYFPADVDLFKKVEGLDYRILDEPIGKILYTEENGFDVDMDYTRRQKAALDKLQEDYLDQKANQEAKLKQKQKEYDAVIKVADKAFGDEEWEKAEAEYKKAAAIMPMETYPSFQLAELETKLIKIRETNEKYNEAIGKADAAVASGDLEIAISQYKRATSYKPEEAYPQDKLKEVQSQLANQAKAEQEYLAAIEKGDNALKINDLELAKGAFEEASAAKPSETYPKNKLAEINDILGKQQAKEEEYNAAIKEADDALAAKEYAKSKAAYQKALSIKSGETYPQEQITKVDGLLAEAAKKEQNYLAAIEKGDQALAANKFEEAKTAFSEASGIKPSEEYPKNKIKEIEDFIAKAEAKEKQYKDKVSEGDNALASKEYENAKTAYAAAASLKPSETYPTEKIAEIDGILADLAKAEENYNAAIAKADKAFAAKDFENAKSAYTEALAIKSEESYPKDQLAEIEKVVVSMQQAQEEYNKAIQSGDDALTNKDYEKARSFYNEGLSLKPEEQYPKDKLAEIDKTLAEAAEKEKNYTAAIEKADAAFGLEKWEEAKAAYNEALKIKQDDYPTEKIEEANAKLAELAAAKAAAAELEASYQAAIKAADQALAAEDFPTAKTKYQEAAELKKEEEYPQTKLSEIDAALEKAAAEEAQYTAEIEKGDQAFEAERWEEAKSAYNAALAIKVDEYPSNRIAEVDTKLAALQKEQEAAAKLEANYQAAISEGDQQIEAKNYEAAIASFNTALSLKPEEEYPTDKIAEIKLEQEKIAKEAAEQERLAALQKEYDALIAKADGELEAENLQAARTSYQSALALKSEESYPQTKIEGINLLLADAAEQDEKYTALVAEADGLLAEEKLEEAKSKYAEAASIKSEEKYPKEKLAEIEKTLADLAAKQEEIRLQNEKQEAIEAEYQELVAEADGLLKEEKYDEAIAKYEAALAVKDDQYPKDKIEESKAGKLALLDAAAAAAEAEKQAAIDKQYDEAIAKADELFQAKKFDEAKEKYNEAISIKSEQYPKDQLGKIDAAIAALADQEAAAAAAEKQAKIEAEYLGLIAEADALLESNELKDAKVKYQDALAVKEDDYPKGKIEEINTRLTELASEEKAEAAAAAQAKIDAEYQALIAEGDALLENSELDAAKGKFEAALQVKDEQYPKDKIAEIAATKLAAADALAEQEAKEKAEAELKVYNGLIADADALLYAKKFELAKTKYEEALGVKEDPYPAGKIAEIETTLNELANKEAEEARLAKLETDYLLAIEQGDQALENNDLQKALASFNEALKLKSEEEYPLLKVSEINSILARREEEKNAEQAALDSQYNEAISLADAAFSDKNYSEAVANYNLAAKAKPNEAYPKQKLVEIENLQAQAAQREEEIRLQQEREARNESAYQTAIATADKLFADKKLNEAENEYQLAQGLKPSEAYPQKQIDKINAVRDKKAAAIAAAERKKKDVADREARFSELMESAQTALKNSTYNLAKREYTEALKIKPNDAYAQAQLKKVEEIIAQNKALESAENKKSDEPIQIQKGPKSTITGDAEAEIEKMYKEIWAKKNSEKNEALREKIEGIRVSMQEQNKVSEEMNLQNYETVQQKSEDVTEAELDRNKNAEREREAILSAQQQKEEKIRTYQQERNLEIVEGKKEMVENEFEEVRVSTESRENKQTERITENREDFISTEKEVQEFSSKRAEENLNKNTDWLIEMKANNKENITTYTESSDERIELEKDAINLKREDLREFAANNAESYLPNYRELDEQLKVYDEFTQSKRSSSTKRIGDQQQNINDIQIEVQQFSMDKDGAYKENQLIIEEKVEDLREEDEELNAESEKRRQDNSSREFYKGDKLPRQDQLSSEYPQGVTEEIVENQNGSTTIRRIVVEGTQTDIYEKTFYSWGGVFYTKNGNNITQETWDAESK